MLRDKFEQTTAKVTQQAINLHMHQWHGCQKCDRHALCGAYCFYSGHVPAQVCFIGKAPDDAENIWGRAFVGDDSEKMYEIIEAVVPPWIDIALTNVVSCTTYNEVGDTRDPSFTERMNCLPRLEEFVKICNPRLIVGVGKFGKGAAEHLSTNVLPRAQWCHINHPSWISRQDDKVLETQRAILELKEGLINVRILQPAS